MPSFRLAHLSDLHLPPPEMPLHWRDLPSKRLLSRLAWRRKRGQHQRQVLELVAEDVLARRPDHIAITGDLTNFATEAEFAAARLWLERLGPTTQVTVSPGNHDTLVRRGGSERFAQWAPWLSDDESPRFPHLRVRGPVAIVNLCSGVPTPWHLAQGRLGAGQLDRTREILSTAGRQGLFRVVLVHHPVSPGVVSGRKALTDAAGLRHVLAETGAELVLHGHAHEAVVATLPGPTRPIPVLGAPSASTPPGVRRPPARWHEIEILDGRIALHARGVTDRLQVEELGAYALA